jgi:hypothetical protein
VYRNMNNTVYALKMIFFKLPLAPDLVYCCSHSDICIE